MAKVNLDVSQTLNITCRRGDTFSLDITLKDSAGDPIALIDNRYQFIMQVRTSEFEDDAGGLYLITEDTPLAEGETPQIGFIEKMGWVNNGGTYEGNNITNQGVVSIKVPSLYMRDIPSGRYVYDFQAKIGESDPFTETTYLRGSFTVNEDVTNAAIGSSSFVTAAPTT